MTQTVLLPGTPDQFLEVWRCCVVAEGLVVPVSGWPTKQRGSDVLGVMEVPSSGSGGFSTAEVVVSFSPHFH